MPTSIARILERRPIETSAPCRVDSGGTWDIKAMALPLQGIQPVTLNVALNLRTRVTLSPLERGRVAVSSAGFSGTEEFSHGNAPLDSPFGIFFAALAFFGFHGVHVQIRSDSPVRSALGGSSTALVALVKALSGVAALMGRRRMPTREILYLAYQLEDAVTKGKCGIQDQAAAAYGGVHLWRWRYGDEGSFFSRVPLLKGKACRELSERILVAYSGKSHVSSRINRSWIDGFLSGETRSGWLRVNDIVHRLAEALSAGEWNRAARLLRKEMAVRREITPDALIPITEALIDEAEEAGCGARFAGAGGGGSLWALGEKGRIERLREAWASRLSGIKGAGILECEVDPVGVR
jgi:D-glycero-alpha-D-manno-heptose-7-phosphate kinase